MYGRVGHTWGTRYRLRYRERAVRCRAILRPLRFSLSPSLLVCLVCPSGSTALMVAAEKGCVRCVKALVQGGANVGLTDSKGRLASDVAITDSKEYLLSISIPSDDGPGTPAITMVDEEGESIVSTSRPYPATLTHHHKHTPTHTHTTTNTHKHTHPHTTHPPTHNHTTTQPHIHTARTPPPPPSPDSTVRGIYSHPVWFRGISILGSTML